MSEEKPILKQSVWYKKIPTMLTLGNSVCGFTAILLALRAYEKCLMRNGDKLQLLSLEASQEIVPPIFATCAWVIIGAMIFDALDGWSARKLNATSLHGVEMDSLADMVTFGVAPAVLVYVYAHVNVFLEVSVFKGHGFLRHDRLVWIAAAVYMGCAALRLALYNVKAMEDRNKEKEEKEKDEGFTGMPSPGAAAAVCSIVIMGTSAIDLPHWVMTIFLPMYTAFLGLLMVSNIPYPHMAKWLVSPKNRSRKMLVLLAVLILCVQESIRFGGGPKITAAGFITAYVLSGPMLFLMRKITGRRLREDDSLVS